jgi:hypothetical protein
MVSAELKQVTITDIRGLADSNLTKALPDSVLIGHLENA